MPEQSSVRVVRFGEARCHAPAAAAAAAPAFVFVLTSGSFQLTNSSGRILWSSGGLRLDSQTGGSRSDRGQPAAAGSPRGRSWRLAVSSRRRPSGESLTVCVPSLAARGDSAAKGTWEGRVARLSRVNLLHRSGHVAFQRVTVPDVTGPRRRRS